MQQIQSLRILLYNFAEMVSTNLYCPLLDDK